MAVEQLLGHIGFLTADGDLSGSQYCVVKQGSTAMTVALATAKNDKLIGVIQNAPTTGIAVDLGLLGVTKIKAGAAITAFDRLTVDSTGRAITATGDDSILGIALEAATGANQIITCLLLGGLSEGAGGGSGIRVARGQMTTASASDTVATGLATVVSAVANMEDAPVIGADRSNAFIGDQAGAPVAGSIIIKSFKPTAAGDATPIAATTFSKKVNWVAIGT